MPNGPTISPQYGSVACRLTLRCQVPKSMGGLMMTTIAVYYFTVDDATVVLTKSKQGLFGRSTVASIQSHSRSENAQSEL
ncbi:hypothetical protein GJAV_G00012320 [Gymnothorax javanicus]|nr:hypothetical protein GJAV_G00012320 [Gymnothorax javanicus]